MSGVALVLASKTLWLGENIVGFSPAGFMHPFPSRTKKRNSGMYQKVLEMEQNVLEMEFLKYEKILAFQRR